MLNVFSTSVRNDMTKYYDIALNKGLNLLVEVTRVVRLKQNKTNSQNGLIASYSDPRNFDN